MTDPQPVPPPPVTVLIQQARQGDSNAADRLLPMIYDELHDVARGIFAAQRPGHTLQPTALIHEAWIKLAGNLDNVQDRKHFFVLAAKAMRQVLADCARGKNRQKRGGAAAKVTLNSAVEPAAGLGIDLIALDDTLSRLTELNERHGRIAELRLFGAMTIQETADVIGVSRWTVEEDWAMAKAWLRRELAPAD